MIYMHVEDKDVWPTEEHVLGWDCIVGEWKATWNGAVHLSVPHVFEQ